MATATPNQRASLLAGLRTGGVRSVSGAAVPHTAAPGGTFNVPRYASMSHYPDIEGDDMLNHGDAIPQMGKQIPLTAAVDGPRFASMQQPQVKQTSQLNANSMPFSPAGFGSGMDVQSMQMQLMQMEILRLQAIQAQQYQAELLAQAQRQVQAQAQVQAPGRRASSFAPATAGPMTTSFGLGAGAPPRRTEQMKSYLSASQNDDQMPMTAALGGRFGGRRSDAEVVENNSQSTVAPSYGQTTIISGGTALGPSPPSTASIQNVPSANMMSKSDSASSWRRTGVNNSVLRSVSSPSVKITPPPSERVSPTLGTSPTVSSPLAPKTRPQPLRFDVASPGLPIVAVESDTDDVDDAASSGSASSSQARTETSPTTSSSSQGQPPLSPREEASRKLYEGLGKGRPIANNTITLAVPNTPLAAPSRSVSMPMRQPRGPPSGLDELAPKNFATRIRRRAIDSLKLNSTRDLSVEAF